MIGTDIIAKTLKTLHKRDVNGLIAFLARIVPII